MGPGPRRGELAAVTLQLKHREQIILHRGVFQSAVSAADAFASSSAGPSWSRRPAFVVLSRHALPPQRQEDLAEAVSIPVIVVDEKGLNATFGPGLHALVRSSAVALQAGGEPDEREVPEGTNVRDVSRSIQSSVGCTLPSSAPSAGRTPPFRPLLRRSPRNRPLSGRSLPEHPPRGRAHRPSPWGLAAAHTL